MYSSSDPRSALKPTGVKADEVIGQYSDAHVGRFYEEAPQINDPLYKAWVMRGQNILVMYVEARAGAVIERPAQIDEYAVLLDAKSPAVAIEAQHEAMDVQSHSIAFVPPGPSRITSLGDGAFTLILTTRASDLVELCPNNAAFEVPNPRFPELKAWPDPVGGFRIRPYSLDVPAEPGRFGRIFRCTTLMINVLDPRNGPRDRAQVSPHHHDDFEQGSLALAGQYEHHIRWNWTSDMADWRDDVHAVCGSPSLCVIPPAAIHTSLAIGEGTNQLIDIFSPPRHDFSAKQGWVLNAADYPAPAPSEGDQ